MAADPGKLRLNVEIHGGGKGRPVVAVHGFGATLESWRGLVPLVGDRELWLFDLKGHGASPYPPDGKYAVNDHADLVLARIVEQDMRGVTLVGHSLGGGVALLVAIRLIREGRSRLASLVLLDSPAFPAELSWWAKGLQRFWWLSYAAVPLFAASQSAAICAVRMGLRILCRHPENITEAGIKAYAGNLRPPARASALIQTGRGLTSENYAEIENGFRTINVPTLIIWGREDPLVPPEPSSSKLLEGIAGSRRYIPEERCGHIAHEELPNPVLGEIAAFLQ
jgi:pimeloyl-ACP methyl ester carboxylesterase